MLSKLKAWWQRQWPQISTRVGLVLGTLSAVGPQLADKLSIVSPQVSTMCGTVGALASAGLILWNEVKGAA